LRVFRGDFGLRMRLRRKVRAKQCGDFAHVSLTNAGLNEETLSF
jgi:hypothetical protein